MMQLIINKQLYYYTTVLKGIKSYKGSKGQSHLHRFIRNDNKLKRIKNTIDYATINKNSKGVFRFRQFLFQEKVQQNYIAPLNLYLFPNGKWRRQDLQKSDQIQLTKTEIINQDIISNCQKAFQIVFQQYYKNIGKPTYRFILQQEIGKISRMTEQQFNKFISKIQNK